MISAVEEELKLHAHTAAVMGIDLDKVGKELISGEAAGPVYEWNVAWLGM
jgi:hypothetical protein